MPRKNDKSNEKGRAFQRKVAELYTLLGAQVDEDIEICGKKVDLFVNILVPGSNLRHRIIVECKAEKTNRAQNQRVMEFKGLLGVARESGRADSVEIISLEPWSEPAKSFARQAGIELLTYEQKVRSLIDLSGYLAKLSASVRTPSSADVREPPLASYYVSLRGDLRSASEPHTIKDLLAYLSKWANQKDGQNRIALLGEYGLGKTSLCRMLAAELAEQYTRDPENRRIPILLNLREYTKSVGIEALISSFLDQECGVSNPRYRLFDAMHRAGLFLLILDGFDEMASRTDFDTIELNLSELEKLTNCPQSRLMVTTRPEYFATQAEQESALRPSRDRALLRSRSASYEEIVIAVWSDEQIEEFLKKRIGMFPETLQPWEYYRDKIHEIDDLRDLSRRPILAEMIVKTLPFLIESGEKVDRLSLYNKYLLSELQRQKIEKRRRLLHGDEKRLELLEKFAAESYQDNARSITFARARESLGRLLSPPEDDLTPLTRDFLSCSFLIRNQDDFVFSHRSIQEYLTAQAFLKEIKFAELGATISRSPLDRAVLSFMLERREEITQSETVLLKWIERTRYYAGIKEPYLGGNAATLLCCTSPSSFAGKDFSKVSLKGAKLCGADLLETDFTGAFLYDVDLRKASVSQTLLQRAGKIQARGHLLFTLRAGRDEDGYVNELAAELLSMFAPAAVTEEGKGVQEEWSQIQIHNYDVFDAAGTSCGYLDATLDGWNTFDRAIKYLADLPAIQDAWFYEIVEQRSAPSREHVNRRLPEVCGGSFFDRLNIKQ